MGGWAARGEEMKLAGHIRRWRRLGFVAAFGDPWDYLAALWRAFVCRVTTHVPTRKMSGDLLCARCRRIVGSWQ